MSIKYINNTKEKHSVAFPGAGVGVGGKSQAGGLGSTRAQYLPVQEETAPSGRKPAFIGPLHVLLVQSVIVPRTHATY